MDTVTVGSLAYYLNMAAATEAIRAHLNTCSFLLNFIKYLCDNKIKQL